jgi:hypothetical protein
MTSSKRSIGKRLKIMRGLFAGAHVNQHYGGRGIGVNRAGTKEVSNSHNYSKMLKLQPTPDAPLICGIFFAKTGFEIFLLWNNYYELQQKEHWKQQEKSPRQPEGKRTSNV